MKEYRYEAVDEQGQPLHGVLQAEDRDALRAMLERRGHRLVSVAVMQVPEHQDDLARTPARLSQLRITDAVRTAFLTQLPVDVVLSAAAREPVWNPVSALLSWTQFGILLLLLLSAVHAVVSGAVTIPLSVALTLTVLVCGPAVLLVRYLERRPKRLLRQMAERLRAGQSDLHSMSRLLPGRLAEIARSDLQEDKKLVVISELMSDTSGSNFARHRLFLDLLGPVFLLLASLGVCYAFLGLVVPGFREIFYGFALDLPGLTQLIVAVSRSIESLGLSGAVLIGLAACGAVICLFLIVYQGWMNAALESVPLLGTGLRWVSLAGIARWLAALLRGSAAPDEALRLAVRHSLRVEVQQDGTKLAEMIGTGRMPASGATSLSGLPLSLLSGLAKEPTDHRRRNAVATTLDGLAGMFERAVFSSGRIIASVIQVSVLALLGGIVGICVLALFLPLIQLLNDLS